MMSVSLRFPGDRIATFTCSFGAADMSRYTLLGTKGALTADPAYEYAEAIKHHITIGGKTRTKIYPKRDQFAAEIAYFSDCILKDKEPEPSGVEGLADVRIVEAIQRSIKERTVVSLPKFSVERRPTLRQELHRSAHGKPQLVDARPASRQAA
jgi:glucose-fructose oxidoreductase